MKCPKCNTINPDNSITCKKCGHIFNFRKVLGMRFFSQILIILFFVLTIVGVLGPILTNTRGILVDSQVRTDTNFMYFFSNMWAELLAYKGANIQGYHFQLFRCIILGLSCVVAIGGTITTLLVSLIKMFQSHHKNQYARLSIRKMFLYSFIPALQYLVLVRFNFYSTSYNAFTGARDMTSMGWGAILILIGLVAGFVAVVIEEVPQLEKVDSVGLTRYIAFRIVTGLLIVAAFVGTASYVSYSYTATVVTEPYPVVCHENVVSLFNNILLSGREQGFTTLLTYSSLSIATGGVAIIALFFTIYNTFTKRRGLLWISINVFIVCSVVCGVLARIAADNFFDQAAGKYLTTLGSATTNSIVIGALAIIALAYEFLNEKHGGNLFVKKED